MNRVLLLLSISLLCCLPLAASACPLVNDAVITSSSSPNDPPVQLPPVKKDLAKPIG